ncbi:hypothetical protein CYPRO_3023 [Cyclonatronum proteinivorum]|uniref:Uncharacterized protein n=1 Tax=Cyclonatronum proteinivorum TaxID=1457365 RepID=A0A345UP58_9BACT|nr:hypothetical protein CYPRO_3023 [Cyclonatronum proteinivorum]
MPAYVIRMGVPEMESFWDDLLEKRKSDSLSADERELFKFLEKPLGI